MTVIELIKELQILATSGHADKEVVFSSDPFHEEGCYFWLTDITGLMKKDDETGDVAEAPDIECNVICIN